jgi:hypothetical protein
MMRWLRLCLVLCCGLPSTALAQQDEAQNEDNQAVLSFAPRVDAAPSLDGWLSHPLYLADVFYYQGDMFRAVGEYERFLAMEPLDTRRSAVKLKIAWIYARSERLAASAGVLAEVIETRGVDDRAGLWARLYYGDVATEAKQRSLAKRAYEVVLEACERATGAELAEDAASIEALMVQSECPLLVVNARLGLAKYWASEHNFAEAAKMLEDIQAAGTLGEDAQRVATYVKGLEIPSKSPGLAGVLSIVPGLGHFYIEDYSAGIVALLWNGAFIYALVDSIQSEQIGQAILIGLLESVWYTGTIFGAVSGAHRFNRDALEIVEQGLHKDVEQLRDKTPWPARFPVGNNVPQVQFKVKF